MSTTTLRLPDDLRARIAQAAKRAGITPHLFMLEAVAEKTEQAERLRPLRLWLMNVMPGFWKAEKLWIGRMCVGTCKPVQRAMQRYDPVLIKKQWNEYSYWAGSRGAG